MTPPRTARGARIPRRSPLTSPAGPSSRTPRAPQGRSPRRRSEAVSRSSAPGPAPSTRSVCGGRRHNSVHEAGSHEAWTRRRAPRRGRSGHRRAGGAADRGVPPPTRSRHVGSGPDVGWHAPRGHHGAGLLRGADERRAGGLLPAGRRRLTFVVATSALVIVALAVVAFGPTLVERFRRWRPRRPAAPPVPAFDPGRERRAEARARELLRSIVSADEYAMYAELGFIALEDRKSVV